jgi:hypothetical protein
MKLSDLWSRFLHQLRAFHIVPDKEPFDYPFVTSDVAQLHRLQRDPAVASVDDATWKDLLLDTYCAELSPGASIFGQHMLYQRLRTGAASDGIQLLAQNPERTAALHQACGPLRHADQEIATLLFEDTPPLAPRWVDRTWPLPLVLLVSFAGIIWSPWAWLVLAATLYFLVSNQMRHYQRVEAWARSLKSVQTLLRVSGQLEDDDAAAAARLNRALSPHPLIAAVPGLRGYLDWFMLENVNHYFRSARLVHAELPLLRRCFLRIANLEADVAVARHLQRTASFCWNERGTERHLTLRDTVHPLLPQAQALTIALDGQGAFISGQNGVGKSTLLRTLGINLVTARAFGFCYASQAVVPDLPVYTSMQSEDSLFGGESLYMAELRRARELLDAAEGIHPGIYIVDEIFRGTNHLESVSAAASVLDVLAARGLVIVSSHNLVLASLLAHRLEPLCVSKGADGTLGLVSGVLAQTNGIALLAERGFGADVEAGAGRVFEWLNGYLAHPADCSGVLGT